MRIFSEMRTMRLNIHQTVNRKRHLEAISVPSLSEPARSNSSNGSSPSSNRPRNSLRQERKRRLSMSECEERVLASALITGLWSGENRWKAEARCEHEDRARANHPPRSVRMRTHGLEHIFRRFPRLFGRVFSETSSFTRKVHI
jgi:hypothetical protein